MNNSAWINNIQYKSDKSSLEELYKNYQIEGYIRMWEERQKKNDTSIRNKLANDGVLLTRTLSPRIFRILDRIMEKLKIKMNFEVFSIDLKEINAYAYLDINTDGIFPLIAISAKALEELCDDEIAFILGHEIGHLIFKHNRVLTLIDKSENNKSRQTVLPHLGEHLFQQWRKMSEISADRVGLLCSGSFQYCARALIKTGFGLSEKNLNLDINNLLKQIEAIKEKPEILDNEFKTHPLLPIRLKALEVFSESISSAEGLDTITSNFIVDHKIDELFTWLKRTPKKESSKAVLNIIASEGLKIITAGDCIEPKQIKELYLILHKNFMEEPESILSESPQELESRAQQGYGFIRENRDDSHNPFILCRLADIALAYGTITEDEAEIIVECAEQLGLSRNTAIEFMLSASNHVGFKTDTRLNNIVEKLKAGFNESLCEKIA